MKKALSLFLAVSMPGIFGGLSSSQAQEPVKNEPQAIVHLTNKDVVDMTKAGLSADVIVAKIKSSPSKFETTPAALAELKSAGISDAVILAMVQTLERSDTGPASAEPNAGGDATIKVADGTEIEIQLTNTLSGQSAKIGDLVDFTVVRPVLREEEALMV